MARAGAAALGREVTPGMKAFKDEPNGSLGQLKESQNRTIPGVSTSRLLRDKLLSYSNHSYVGSLLLIDELCSSE